MVRGRKRSALAVYAAGLCTLQLFAPRGACISGGSTCARRMTPVRRRREEGLSQCRNLDLRGQSWHSPVVPTSLFAPPR